MNHQSVSHASLVMNSLLFPNIVMILFFVFWRDEQSVLLFFCFVRCVVSSAGV